MEISILLAEQIIAMFLTMAVGFGVVRAGLFKTEDSRIISNMVVYICNPCVVVHAFQIELTDDKIKGLMIAVGMSVIVHVILIVGSEILSYIIHFNSIEKASIIYTNAGYLVIPLVSAVLGEEWVFYTTAFILVQTILMWTHGVNLIGQEKNLNIRKILCNPNVIAMIIGIALSAFRSSEVYRKKKASIMWDCSVTCMEASTSEKYVINYADSKVISKTGALTIQNRNDFDIVVHLLCEGEPEIVSDEISSGGCYSFLQVATDKEYTVGIHAAVDTKTEIKVFVYDGKDTEPYTK